MEPSLTAAAVIPLEKTEELVNALLISSLDM